MCGSPSLRGAALSYRTLGAPWGFSTKTVREWFRDEHGPGILRQPNIGRHSKRDYTTVMIAPSAAARIYAKRTGGQERVH
jgi:hypothetical protein